MQMTRRRADGISSPDLKVSHGSLRRARESVLSRHEGKDNFHSLINTQLSTAVESSLQEALVVSPCPVYSEADIRQQEKQLCAYKFMDSALPLSVQWITVVDGRFVNNKKECAAVIDEMVGRIERVPWKMTHEEKKRKADEGAQNVLFTRLVTKFAEAHNEEKVKALSLEYTKIKRADEKRQKTRGDS